MASKARPVSDREHLLVPRRPGIKIWPDYTAERHDGTRIPGQNPGIASTVHGPEPDSTVHGFYLACRRGPSEYGQTTLTVSHIDAGNSRDYTATGPVTFYMGCSETTTKSNAPSAWRDTGPLVCGMTGPNSGSSCRECRSPPRFWEENAFPVRPRKHCRGSGVSRSAACTPCAGQSLRPWPCGRPGTGRANTPAPRPRRPWCWSTSTSLPGSTCIPGPSACP